MNDELDRIINELGILRVNIASMAARVESLQGALEQLKKIYPEQIETQGVEHTDSMAEKQPTEPIEETEQISENEYEDQSEDIIEDQIDEIVDDVDDVTVVEHECDATDDPDAEMIEEQVDETHENINQERRDLRQFFTINDRYRFRRELFGNSDSSMADTLNMIEAMANVDEVQDYVYTDLEWDAENEEVQEFMTIINRYFNER